MIGIVVICGVISGLVVSFTLAEYDARASVKQKRIAAAHDRLGRL